jgi:hypothetical protein
MTPAEAALPERPPISAPDHPVAPSLESAQPRLGLLGLLLIVPIAALLAVGAGGADSSALVLGPLVTYGLPLVAMVAFWWEDWPGTMLRPSWSGWADTALIIVGAVLLTALGQIVVADLDLRSIFDPTPGHGHVPTFPATMPLAAVAFVAMLQLTLVGEGWPLRRLPRLAGGLVALAIAWAVAVVVYFALADVRSELGTVLIPDRRLAGALLRRLARLAVLGHLTAAAAIDVRARRRPCERRPHISRRARHPGGRCGATRGVRGVLRGGRPACSACFSRAGSTGLPPRWRRSCWPR